MKTLVKFFVAAILLVGATAGFVFGQGMVYQTHQEMTLAAADGLKETWVQLPNNDYVRVTTTGSSVTVESTAGWDVTWSNVTGPCVAQYNGTIWCAVGHIGGQTVTIGGTTHPAPPSGQAYTILVKLSSSGTVLGSWQAVGNMWRSNIAVKDNSEIAVVGKADLVLEHLTSPNGGGVVLIHNGTDWDATKGFFIEAPSGAGKPNVLSTQYLPNGNLALAGYTDGGTVSFGGITLPPHGGNDGFRGEITSTGVGITAVQMASSADDLDNIQITKADGSFMVTGTYNTPITFYNANGTVGGSLGQFPSGCSHDNVYFAYYNASGVFQNAEVVYNAGCTTDMLNIDLVYGNNAFYAMINNSNGGTVTTPTGSHSDAGPIILKFDNMGNPVWSKQFQNVSGPVQFQYGEEILVSGDIVTLTGTEYIACDLDFSSSVVSISSTSYWAEYFDGTSVGPTADFSGTPLNGEAPLSVSFTDLSVAGTNGITSWTWTFPGGTPGTYSGQNPPAISYATAGTYDVTLVVSDGSLSDTEVKTDYITVTAPPPSLSINPTFEDVDETSGNVYPNILSNVSWTVENVPSWMTVSPISGNGDQELEVSYQANLLLASRSGTFDIVSTETNDVTFTVNQEGATASMELNPSGATVNADDTSTSTLLSTQSDMSWTVDASGLPTGWSVAPMSGTGNDTFVVTLTVNTGTDPINGSFTINGTGLGAGTTVMFPITQLGAGAPLEAMASSDKPEYFIGETIHLFGSATGGTGNYTYSWTGTGGFTSSLQNPTFDPTNVGTYTFTVIVDDGENTATDNVVVSVGEVIVILESNTQTAEAGVPVHFTITVDGATVDEIIFETDGDQLSGFVNPWEFDYTYQNISGSPYDVEITVITSTGFIYNVSYPNYMDVITGINDVYNAPIKIYPNPTSSSVFINAGKSVERLSVINTSGSEVIHLENLREKAQIDLSSLPSGVYFVRVYANGVFTTQKVVKR